jgi:hypothetical protein
MTTSLLQTGHFTKWWCANSFLISVLISVLDKLSPPYVNDLCSVNKGLPFSLRSAKEACFLRFIEKGIYIALQFQITA